MDRRNFLKSGIIAGAGATAATGISACSTNGSHETTSSTFKTIEHVPEIEVLDIIENEKLKLTLFNNGSFKISDKVNNVEWETFSVAIQDKGEIEESHVWNRGDRTLMEQYPSRFVVKKEGEKYHYTVIDRQHKIWGTFIAKITLESDWMSIDISDITDSLPSLVFPSPIISEAIILPVHAGKMLKRSEANIWYRQYLPFHTSLNMHWFGGVKNDAAWIAVFDDEAMDAGAMVVNSSVTAAWMRSLGKWNQAKYGVKYKFIKGNYVELAKTYRQYLIDNGRFKTLKEKIEKKPNLEKMLGGRTLSYFQAWPYINKNDTEDFYFTPEQIKKWNTKGTVIDFTHKEVKKSVEYAKTKGFSKGQVMLRGWIKGGYDASHPDIWPPEPSLGSLDELKDILNTNNTYTTALHDNYQDIYATQPSYPEGILQRPNGDLVHGGFWAGGQAYIINSRNSLEYLKRNWPNISSLGADGIFPDTLAASKLEQSYEPGNTLTKLQDYKLKQEIIKFLNDQGQITGSEEGSDFVADTCDWFENRHSRHAGETIPLWGLVFHDCTFASRYTSFEPGSAYPKILEDMLWGNHLQFFMSPNFGNISTKDRSTTVGFGANSMTEELFTSTFHVDKWHEKIGLDEMIDHNILTSDGNVEETEWSSGQKIIVNFNTTPENVGGISIPGHGYKIL